MGMGTGMWAKIGWKMGFNSPPTTWFSLHALTYCTLYITLCVDKCIMRTIYLKASAVKCWLIPSIDFPITIRSTLYQHLINSCSRPTVDWAVDGVSMKCWSRVSINTWQQMPLVQIILQDHYDWKLWPNFSHLMCIKLASMLQGFFGVTGSGMPFCC